jgi:hypothetical protein
MLAAWAPIALAAPPARADAARTPPPAEVRAWQTGLLRADRIEHLSLSWTLGLAAGFLTRRPEVALGGVAAIGFAKEIADRNRTGFDGLDLAADLVGGASAAAVSTLWRR